MQFIGLPKAIDIAERVLPELVADCINTKRVQNINISVIQTLQVNLLTSWVIKWSKRRMPHRRIFSNFTNQAGAIWDLSRHKMLRMIPNLGSQMRVTFSSESIHTIPFRPGARYLKIPEWGQHCFNRGMRWLVSIIGTFRGTGDQPNNDPGARFRCAAAIVLNSTNREIQRPGMLVAQTIGQVGLVGCTNNWHNRHSGRKLIMPIPASIVHVDLAVYSATFRVYKVNCCKIGVRLKSVMSHKELDSFENIPVV